MNNISKNSNNNKEIYLHIGLQKTGTTAIQKYLASNYKTLLNSGILYPKSCRSKIKHNQLFDVIAQKQSYSNTVWDQLVQEISSSTVKKVIISDEAFCLFDQSQIKIIKQKLSSLFDVKVIIFLREPSSFLFSLYKYNIKCGNAYYSFNEFLNRNISRCDYQKIVLKWSQNFGEENILIQSYEATKNIGLIKSLFLVMKVSNNYISTLTSQIDSLHSINTALNDSTLKCLRLLNKIKYALPFLLNLNGKKIAKYKTLDESQKSLLIKIRLDLALKWIDFIKVFSNELKKETKIGLVIEYLLYPLIRVSNLYKNRDLEYIKRNCKSLNQAKDVSFYDSNITK